MGSGTNIVEMSRCSFFHYGYPEICKKQPCLTYTNRKGPALLHMVWFGHLGGVASRHAKLTLFVLITLALMVLGRPIGGALLLALLVSAVSFSLSLPP